MDKQCSSTTIQTFIQYALLFSVVVQFWYIYALFTFKANRRHCVQYVSTIPWRELHLHWRRPSLPS